MKVLILCVGVSGSGKSTLAAKIKHQYIVEGHSAVIWSTDDRFMVEGHYKFDPSKLGLYHQQNREAVDLSMINGIECIIVDNTNLTKKERKPYVELAKKYGYNVLAIEPTTAWKRNTAELAQKNKHGVPVEAIQRMLDRYEPFSKEELN